MNQLPRARLSLRSPSWAMGVLLGLVAGCDPGVWWSEHSHATREGDEIPCSVSLPCSRDEGLPPHCDLTRGVCVRCESAKDSAAACAARTPSQRSRYCAPSADYPAEGTCVDCLRASHCDSARGESCWRGRCVPSCERHADCAESQTCDHSTSRQGVSSPGSRGACVPSSVVRYVDSSLGANGSCNGDGVTQDRPLCRLTDAFANPPKVPLSASPAEHALARIRAFRLLTSMVGHEPLEAPSALSGASAPSNILLFGSDRDDEPRARIGGDPQRDALRVGRGQRLVLERVDVLTAKRGVYCDGTAGRSAVSVRSGVLSSLTHEGVWAEDCQVSLDRVTLREAQDGAFKLWGRSDYQITNSFLVDNNAMTNPVLLFSNQASGIFRFNTVANNRSVASRALACKEGGQVLQDSILVGNRPLGSDRAQQDGGCQLARVATDDANGDVPLGAPDFLAPGDYRLLATDKSRACCIDKGIARASFETDPTRPELPLDYYQLPRLYGPAADRGAHEVIY